MGQVQTIDKVAAVREHIANSYGSENYYRHIGRVIYTDGVKGVADICGAYWLLDIIASWQYKPSVKAADFQIWQLTKEPDGNEKKGAYAVRCWLDTPGKSGCVAVQYLEGTDFPVELMPFDLWLEVGEYPTVLLPSEH